MTIGLPTIDINFKKLAATAIARSSDGIAALIVKDDTDPTHSVKEYKSVLAIDSTKFTAANVQYIKDVLTGGPSKVIVVPVPTESLEPIQDAITSLGYRKYNWIGLAEGTAEEHADLAAYVKEQEAAKRSIKGLVYNVTADSQHVVNFTNPDVTYTDGTKVTGEKYIARLLGVLAGLPLTRSSTYYQMTDLLSVTEPANVETAINNGQFVLFNDDEVVRIARGVNSLTTLTATVPEDFKKIVIVETMDLIREDITNTFKNDFIGKFKNKYDNQLLFITAINAYLAALAEEDLLDNAFDNRADVDVEAQRAAWIAAGKAEAADWDDQTVRNNSFGSKVFLAGNIKITDAMEDLQFDIDLQ